jgi:Flp pilus assembly protein TadD
VGTVFARSSLMRNAFFIGLLAVTLARAQTPLDRARLLYSRAEYKASLEVLRTISEDSAALHALTGQDYFMLGEEKRASEAFQKAVREDPGNSDYYLWLGRSYGRRAEMSNPFSAMNYASKARQYFEKAIELDPKNTEAINDLFEYYLEAPGVLGGGLNKAANIADRIAKLDPIEGHYAQARLAEKQKEFHRAEQHLRRAVELAPREIGRIVDLAKFLANQGRFDESDAVFASADRINPNSPKLLFARAASYIRYGRKLDTARDLLKRYLAANLTPDDPPRSEAQKLLTQVGG